MEPVLQWGAGWEEEEVWAGPPARAPAEELEGGAG